MAELQLLAGGGGVVSRASIALRPLRLSLALLVEPGCLHMRRPSDCCTLETLELQTLKIKQTKKTKKEEEGDLLVDLRIAKLGCECCN